jgi:hypothetical protein
VSSRNLKTIALASAVGALWLALDMLAAAKVAGALRCPPPAAAQADPELRCNELDGSKQYRYFLCYKARPTPAPSRSRHGKN